jgi:hypothetical protein
MERSIAPSQTGIVNNQGTARISAFSKGIYQLKIEEGSNATSFCSNQSKAALFHDVNRDCVTGFDRGNNSYQP